MARIVGGFGARQRGDGELVLGLTRELIVLRRVLGEHAHQLAGLVHYRAHRRHGDDSEGLVDLEQIDIAFRPARLFE